MQACFELVRAATVVMDAEAIPSEKLILTLLSILALNDGDPLPFRYSSWLASLMQTAALGDHDLPRINGHLGLGRLALVSPIRKFELD